ncbi:MAG TPA: FHA domain-containing protein, partial [Thermoanaerobaculia bacterium]|nr:FHA domain-containing protein [Thermoanaerobaculia bacterium]
KEAPMLALETRTSALPAPILRLAGGGRAAEHPLPPGSELVLGRSPQCDVVLDHTAVSRMHARVFAEGGEVYLEDLGAANGTFVDGRQVFGTVRLHDGQTIELGRSSEGKAAFLGFEDLGERFLREMGLQPEAAGKEAEAGEEPAELEDASGETALAAHSEEENAAPAAPGRPWFLSPVLLGGAAAILLLGGAAVWGLLAALRPAPVPWHSVPAIPAEVEAGGLRAAAPAPIAIAVKAVEAKPVEAKPAEPAPIAPAAPPASADLKGGALTFELENVFFPKDAYTPRLELDLERRGSGLSGTARFRFEKGGLEWSLPPVWVEGALRGREIDLSGSFPKPVGSLRLTGIFEGERWGGVFRGTLVRGEGRWREALPAAPAWPQQDKAVQEAAKKPMILN